MSNVSFDDLPVCRAPGTSGPRVYVEAHLKLPIGRDRANKSEIVV